MMLDDKHTKSHYSPNVRIIFPQMQKPFSSVLPKRVYLVSLRMLNKSAQRKPAKHRKHHMAKFQSEVRLLSPKHTAWKQRREILASERRLQLFKVITPPVIKQLSWYGAVCPRSCFCVQQKFDYPVSYKAGTSKVSTFTKSNVQSWFTYEGDKQKRFSKADSLVDKILFCPRIKLSNSQILILGCVETRSSLLDFAQQLRRKNAEVPDLYFTLLDAAGISPTLILNQIVKAKERGS